MTVITLLLTVQNIAKISSASIEINGITVIAGENNTGKSTIGNRNQPVRMNQIFKIANEIVLGLESSIDSIESINNKIVSIVSIASKNENVQVIDNDEIKKLSNKIYQIIKITDDEIQPIILNRYFKAEFESQINHVNGTEISATASLQTKQKQLSVEFINNTCSKFKNEISIISEAIYIDTPLVLDDLDEFFNDIKHQDNLKNRLTRKKSNALEKIFDEAINTQKLESATLFIRSDDEWYLIEFKNGSVDNGKNYEVKVKIYESLLILLDIINQSINFSRQYIHYILVYNETRDHTSNQFNKDEFDAIQYSEGLSSIQKYFSGLAKETFIQFGLSHFKKLYFRSVNTYTKRQFERDFVQIFI